MRFMNRSSGMTTLFALLLMSSPVAAQSLSTGSIGGTVQSAGGGPVQGAMLTLVHTVSGVARSVTPSGSGTFEFGVLPTGEYELRAEQFGYRPLLLTGVVVRPGQRLEVPVEMTAVTGPAERVDTLRLRERSAGGAESGDAGGGGRGPSEQLPDRAA
jgi:hypothetical protein